MDGSNICYRRANRIIVKEIILNQTQKDLLQEHATKYASSESCAMLLGIQNEQQWNVKEVFLTRNADTNSERDLYNFARRSSIWIQTCRRKTYGTSWYFSLSPKLSCNTIKY